MRGASAFSLWLIANRPRIKPGTPGRAGIALVLAHGTYVGSSLDGASSSIQSQFRSATEAHERTSGELGMILARESAGDGLLDMSETFAHGLSVAEKLICCSI
jgi:hypothetical protein